MIAATVDWRVLTAVGLLLALAMVLLYRLLNRDPTVRRTRYGLFVERDRFDEEPPWPQLAPPVERTLPAWPDKDKTVELPPDEQG